MRFVLNLLKTVLAIAFIAQAQAEEMRDPTRPSGFQASSSTLNETMLAADGLRLQAIFFHPDHPGALINGRRFSVGEDVGDARITAIYADKIILTDASGAKEVRLITSSIKSREDSGQNPAVQEIEK